jgi:hypothetical protein
VYGDVLFIGLQLDRNVDTCDFQKLLWRGGAYVPREDLAAIISHVAKGRMTKVWTGGLRANSDLFALVDLGTDHR